jgi:hypothetical protein
MRLFNTFKEAEVEALKKTVETGIDHYATPCAVSSRFTVLAEKCKCGRAQKLPVYMKCFKCVIDDHQSLKRGDVKK